MKIKTLVFWILWVGNSVTLQTANGEDLEPVSPPLFSGDFEDVDLLCQTPGWNTQQKEHEQVWQLAGVLGANADSFGVVRIGIDFAV
jgi:hypothetical protein